jgi:hypothetical protein
MDAASSWTHSASTPRSSICAEPGTTPPRHRPDSTIPRVCTTTPTIPSRFQHNPPPKGRQTTKQSVPPAYGEAVTPAPRSVWPPAPILRKGEPARWPLWPTAAPRTEPPLRGRYPPLHKPSTAQAEAVKTDKANPSLPTARAGGDHR